MKVLHVIPWVGPVRGGPPQAVLEIVPAQNKLGIQAEIVTTNDNGPGLLDVPLATLTQFQGAPTRFFPRWSPKFRPLRDFVISRPLGQWLRQHMQDYDLVHVHAMFTYPSTMAMCIARRQGIPYINRPLGLLCQWSLRQSPLRKRIFLATMERANLNGSRGLECTAEQEVEEAQPLGLTAPFQVLPFGLHMPAPIPNARRLLREKFHLPAERPVVLFLSRLHPKKGLDLLLDALELMPDLDFTLIAAGSGEQTYEASLRARIQEGPLAGRVILPGFAQGADKDLLFQGADVFALTSHSESFAIAALEALAAGIPAVLTPGVPLASLVKKHQLGAMVEMDAKQIAEALRALLTQGPDAQRSERSRLIVEENFTWEIIAQRSVELYEAVLQKRPLPSWNLESV
jgi:glycosyltransferase involved in cell wall biosynthesis